MANRQTRQSFYNTNPATFLDWRARNHSFTGLAGFREASVTFSARSSRAPERRDGERELLRPARRERGAGTHLHSGRRGARRGSRRGDQRRPLAHAVCGAARHRRPGGALRRRELHDCRRRAAARRLPGQGAGVDTSALVGARRSAPAAEPESVRRSEPRLLLRHWPAEARCHGSGGGCRHGRGLARAHSRLPEFLRQRGRGDHDGARGSRRRSAIDHVAAVRRGRPPAADRGGERLGPADRPRNRAAAGDGGSDRARRDARTHRRTAPHRERAARGGRRRRRRAARDVGGRRARALQPDGPDGRGRRHRRQNGAGLRARNLRARRRAVRPRAGAAAERAQRAATI